MLPHEIALSLAIHPREMDGAVPLNGAGHLGDGVFRGDGDHHVHVVDHEVTFFDPAFLLLRQSAENLAEMLPKLPVEHLPATLRDENDVVFARPFRVA